MTMAMAKVQKLIRFLFMNCAPPGFMDYHERWPEEVSRFGTRGGCSSAPFFNFVPSRGVMDPCWTGVGTPTQAPIEMALTWTEVMGRGGRGQGKILTEVVKLCRQTRKDIRFNIENVDGAWCLACSSPHQKGTG